MSTKKDNLDKKDNFYMNIALKLAMSKHGLTGENPAVGCVIVKDNNIISIGTTGIDGRPHAETVAINSSIEKVEGSTMYVTLEPCSHYGKTPPCTNLIVKNKIKKVFFGIEDIDKKVKGKTLKILNKSKIEVKKNLLHSKIKDFYFPYFKNRLHKMPYVTGKIAKTKNNLIYNKKYKKITSPATDKFTHFLRYKNDAILISSKTLNIDNPKLNCRLKEFERFSPIRVILDSKLNMSLNSYIFKTTKKNKTIVFYNSSNKSKINLFKKNGFQIYKVPLDKKKKLSLKLILKRLFKEGCRNLLVEGGSNLTKSFLDQKLFDRFYIIDNKKNIKLNKNSVYFDNYQKQIKAFKFKIDLKNHNGKDKITLYRN